MKPETWVATSPLRLDFLCDRECGASKRTQPSGQDAGSRIGGGFIGWAVGHPGTTLAEKRG